MEPIKFKESNITFAENQKEYKDLPAYKDNGIEGIIISCWKMNFKERIIILFTGKIWLWLWSFNKPLTPSLLETKNPFKGNKKGMKNENQT
jgi:hypothetical protein